MCCFHILAHFHHVLLYSLYYTIIIYYTLYYISLYVLLLFHSCITKCQSQSPGGVGSTANQTNSKTNTQNLISSIDSFSFLLCLLYSDSSLYRPIFSQLRVKLSCEIFTHLYQSQLTVEVSDFIFFTKAPSFSSVRVGNGVSSHNCALQKKREYTLSLFRKYTHTQSVDNEIDCTWHNCA